NLHPVIPSKTENQNQKPKIPSFPRRRESRSVSAGTYRIKRFLEILHPGGFAFEVQLSLTEKGQYAVAYDLSC
ncbi:hypothetical protein, partial [Neisseria meningitidis]|uniref:hypothetical protein n=1 Tax=Neisseria meningitidis TaxID=487 RepID=UPI001EDCFAC3